MAKDKTQQLTDATSRIGVATPQRCQESGAIVLLSTAALPRVRDKTIAPMMVAV